MTTFDVIATLFDTAVWCLNNKELSKETKLAVVDELKQILHATNQGYQHEKYIKIDGVWTHSGGTTDWTLAETCKNKRHSFFLVCDGRAVALDGDNVQALEIGNYIAVAPNKSIVLLVAPTSRVTRVFLDEPSTFISFARSKLCQPPL